MARRTLFNTLARRVTGSMIGCRCQPLTDDELRAVALVVAPHPDDETLGCGGTIMRKRELDADVHVVFTTDGSGSHRGVEPAELARRRVDEAAAACERLGIARDRIMFLALPDGALQRHEQSATLRLADMLRSVQPQQVFAPYRHDNHPDHLATTRAVVSAIAAVGQPCTLLEYPVWFWEHWPWMDLPPWLPHRRRRVVTRALRSPLCGWRDFNRLVDVADVLDRKRAALAAHETQMTAQSDGWTTLAEIADGEFLARLLTDREIFAERQFA